MHFVFKSGKVFSYGWWLGQVNVCSFCIWSQSHGKRHIRQVKLQSSSWEASVLNLQRTEGLFVLVLSCFILLKLSSMQKQNQLTIAAILEKPDDEYALSS